MNFVKLRGFYMVVRAGGFSEAAKRLHLTQPAVSHQIRSLERELGVRLIRRGRPIGLTKEGELLFDMAESLFAEVNRIQAVFADLKTRRAAVLNLAANQSTAMHVLPERLTVFTKRFPSVEITIHTMRTREIVDAVADGSIDVGMVLADPQRPDIAARPALPYEMVLVVPRGHPLAAKRRIELDDIARYPFISYTKATQTRYLIDEPFRERHLRIRIRMSLGSTDLIIKYVALGYGIAIVHNLNLSGARAESVVVRGLKRYYTPQHLQLIWRSQEELGWPAREFVDLF